MIWIRIVSRDGVPASSLALGVPLAAHFGDSVGDIGRGAGCTLVLPDPKREISRKQALVTCQAGRHTIRPIGTNLDIDLNGRPLAADQETPLDAGAELRIGPYRMRVEAAETDAVQPAPGAARAPAQTPERPAPAQPAAVVKAPAQATPPQRAGVQAPQASPPARPAPAQAPTPPAARPGAQAGGAAGAPPQAPVAARNPGQDPLAIFNTPNRSAKGGVFDDLLRGGSAANPPGSQAPPQQPAPRPRASDADRATPAARAGLPAPPADDVDPPQPAARPLPLPGTAKERHAGSPARAPAAPRNESRPAAPDRPPAQGAPPTAANDDFVGSLYGGLGLPVPPPDQRSADKARLIGELLRESLAGTIELLAARQIAKKNLGASATMLQTRGNNPLKFSPNVDAALMHLLGAPLRGFIGPRDAVHDALSDLRAHQVAMLAGMRAALEAVLERFDPVALEARLAPKGMLDQLVPVNRRARLWETFGEQYASILREVEDDWDALFGRAFLLAYERQLAELARPEEKE